jgi:peptidoglycan/LPS O-acetylase OafA/YrhL
MTSDKIVKLDSLTSFRFLAAFTVFLHHVNVFSKYQIGYLGVGFFFMLSGFILVYNYHDKLNSLNLYQSKKFFIARIAKIYPIHIFTFLLAIPYYFFIPLKHEPFLYVFQAFTNLILIHSFIPFGNISFNGVSWSLSDEMFFYTVFPFILYCFYKFKIKIANLVILFTAGLVTLTIIALNTPRSDWFFYFFPGVRIIEFIGGMILGIIFLKTRRFLFNRSAIIFSVLEFSVLCLLIFTVSQSIQVNQNLRYGLVFIPVLMLLIYVFAFQKGRLSKFLSKKLFIYLGNISFSFYMVHNLILSYILFLWNPNINSVVLICACLILAVFSSSLLFHFIEEPMRKKVKNSLEERLLKDESNVVLSRKAL